MRDSKKARNIHEEALARFDRIQTALQEEREQCLQDRRFYSIPGAQWEGAVGAQFANKPKLEVNKIHLSVMKIINEYRNNRITVDFISKDGTPDTKLADVCQGLFRADEQDSMAEEAYDNAFEEAVGGGFGALRVIAEYEDEEDDENENQRIRIEPIYDADNSVYFDLDAKRQDKADAKYCYVMYSMTPEDYRAEFDDEPTSMPKEVQNVEYDWCTPTLVYVAEYYRVEMQKETVHIYQNLSGDEVRYTDTDFENDPELERTLEATGSRKLREKRAKRKRVRKYIISGAKILEDCGYIAGKCIPIVPVYGKRWFVDSIERCMGHVRLVKDSQRLKNMMTSKLAEIAAMSSVEKPIFTPEQMAGHAAQWAEDGIVDYPYQLINPVTDAAGNTVPSGPIGYTKSPNIPPALAALLQVTDADITELLGGSAETDKMLSHVSGKAHEMIQKRIDGQAFIYMSNFAKSVKRVGEIWLSQARDVYVEKGRKMKIIDQMDQSSSVELLAPSTGPIGSEENDLSKASFDVAVDVGPSSASQREAAVQSLIGMLQVTQDPQTAQILQSMILMNMEGDGISETNAYFRKQLVQMGVLKPTEEEAKEMEEAAKNAEPSSQDQALLAMAQKDTANARKMEAETIETIADTEKTKAETLKVYGETDAQRALAAQELAERKEAMEEQRRANAQQIAQNMAQTQAQPRQLPGTGVYNNSQM